MRRLLIICALLITVTVISSRPAMARKIDPLDGGWCTITVRDLIVDSSIFFVRVLPGEAVQIEIKPKVSVTNIKWSVDGGGYLTGSGLYRLFVAPWKPGHYPVKIKARHGGTKLEAVVHVFVLVPFSRVRNGKIGSFEIGTYPNPKERNNSPHYQLPIGFIKVNKADAGINISENYKLGDFLAHNYSKWPQYVLVDEKLVLKMELATRELRARGLMKTRFKVFSAFRPPARNRKAGQAEFSRHQYGCAVDLYIDDSGKKGWMDDLNRDGRINLLDGLVLYRVVDNMEEDGLLKGLEGGIGAYPGRKSYGPFVHIDVRGGGVARWINDQNGRRVKDIAAYLKKPRNRVYIPPRRYQYASREEHIIAAYGGVDSVEGIKKHIRRLEREVQSMEQHWSKVDAGPKPLSPDDLYLAADMTNDSMLLNRGRVILKRMSIQGGEPPPACPGGLADIYRVPEGILQVRGKSVAPVWFEPEWAFLGEKMPLSIKKLRNKFYSDGAAKETIDLGAGIRIYPNDLPGGVVLPGCIGVPPKDVKTLQGHTSKGTRVYLYEDGAYVMPGGKKSSKKQKDLMALRAFLTLRMRAADLGKDYLVLELDKGRGWIKRGEVVVRTLKVRTVGPVFSKNISNARKRFNMPRGVMLVQRRISHPPWYKPDWMYKKQNKSVPGPLGAGRVQTGLLGPCGLYLGGGLVIHGRHDPLVPNNAIDYVAIELGKSDLEWVWRTIPEGGVVILK